MLLLDLLTSQNKINDSVSKDVEHSLSLGTGKSVDVLLTEQGVKEEDIAEARSLLYGLPVYVGDVKKDPELLAMLTVDQARQYHAIPLSLDDQVLSVGIVDPEYANALSALQFIFSQKLTVYKLYIITEKKYNDYVKTAQVVEEKKSEDASELKPNIDVKRKEEGGAGDEKKSEQDSVTDLTPYTGDLKEEGLLQEPVPEIFNQILKFALTHNASDIHIEHIGPLVRIRCRMDGSLETVLTMPPSFHAVLIARIKILCSIKLDEKRKPQDGRFSTRLNEYKVDYRVSTFPGYYGEKVVLRILDSHKGIRPLETVGLSEHHWSQIQDAIGKPYGIILVSGPTGSGKTTTLYSMLGQIDKEHRNVVSLEDPIEYNIQGINQSQVFPEIGYTFASGLRSILRQDPDVILVGEIRDAETAGLAIQAALTGHLVFSTIHTNSAIGVITRLLDMGIEPYLIAPVLNAAVGQRLVRAIAPGCAKSMDMTPALTTMIADEFKDLPPAYKAELPLTKAFSEAQGNDEFPTGLKSRIPVFEILTVDEELEKAIIAQKREDELWSIARNNGMMTLREDAMVKCVQQKVPFEEINSL
jgi:type IV pilus assembly protein PilB